jgi:hypothetical protein
MFETDNANHTPLGRGVLLIYTSEGEKFVIDIFNLQNLYIGDETCPATYLDDRILLKTIKPTDKSYIRVRDSSKYIESSEQEILDNLWKEIMNG